MWGFGLFCFFCGLSIFFELFLVIHGRGIFKLSFEPDIAKVVEEMAVIAQRYDLTAQSFRSLFTQNA
jgi:hypothetical protein